MDRRNRLELSGYRLGRAKAELEVSKEMLMRGNFSFSANRSYYAVFHALRSVLALDGFDAKKHSSVISYFTRNYVRTGIFDAGTSNLIWSAFHVRGYADYEDYYEVSEEEAQKQIDNAEKIISMIEPYLQSRWAEMEDKQ